MNVTRLFSLWTTLAILASLLVPGNAAHAATFPDGSSKLCHLPNGATVPESNVPSQHWAGLTQFPPYGPIISYNPAMIAPVANGVGAFTSAAIANSVTGVQPGDDTNATLFVWVITAYHECAHARTGSPDEIAVNCTAVLSMVNDGRFTDHDIDVQTLAFNDSSLGAIPQPWQYGGSLQAFWNATLRCVRWAENNPGVAPPLGVAAPLTLDPD